MTDISFFTFKLLFLLIPGILATIIFKRLTIHSNWTNFQFTYSAFLFSGLSYLLTGLIVDRINNTSNLTSLLNTLPNQVLPVYDVLYACIGALLLSVIIAYMDHFKVLNRSARILKCSNKYGDEDLFYYFLTSKDVKEIYLRDIQNGLTYHGILESFSTKNGYHEILLRAVDVYKYKNSKLLYSLDKIYISKNSTDLVIELPFKNQGDL